jgi:hypothetical protein
MFFVGLALTGLGVGLSLWEGITSAGSNREQAEYQAESIRKEMEMLRKQKDELSYMYRTKGGQVRDQFSNKMGTLLDRVSQNVLQTEESKRDSVARTGLSYSGTIERKADIQTSGQRQSNIRGQQGLLGGFKSNMLDLSMAETREIGQIDMRLASLEGQYKAAEAASEEKFLGIF